MSAIKLGVNIDHVATIRQARGTAYPSILTAAAQAIAGGADQITVHLREDRRHIQDADVAALKAAIKVPLNLEMAATDEMVAKAIEYHPERVTLVPEKRRELTTEGGLDAAKKPRRLKKIIDKLHDANIEISLFIDPEEAQIQAATDLGVSAIEIHTGTYADYTEVTDQAQEQERILVAARCATSRGLFVAAGHGLTLDNITSLIQIPEIKEYNIGHSIIAEAVFVGLKKATMAMKAALTSAIM